MQERPDMMKAVVVYESHWGNTAAIARAVAEGIAEGTPALSTSEAGAEALAGVELIVAGSPLLGFALPSETMVKGLSAETSRGAPPVDLTHPPMRVWLDALPSAHGCAAAFETRIWWSPGSAAKAILGKLESHGYRAAGPALRFVVQGKYGPLRDGELARAKAWGAELARACVPEPGR